MRGLEKIIGSITEESEIRAAKIASDCENEVKTILADATAKTKEEVERITKKAKAEIKSIGERAGDSAELKKKQILLSGKQELITETIERARTFLKEMEGSAYEELLVSIFKKHVPTKDATLVLSKKAADVLSASDIEEFKKLAAGNNAVLTVSEETKDGDGFVIDFGGIEDNCSIDALIDTDIERIEDMVNGKLFA
ncbi:MAG: V-type ATP synthase subunit E family protein [Eubacteriales bacterium]|nr:V-type ATP synthase subunit E family protein [Eubacteriales bacterium]